MTNNTDNLHTHLREIESSSCANISPALHHRAFALNFSAPQFIIMLNRLRYAIASAHISDCILLFYRWCELFVFNHFHNTLTQLPDSIYFLSFAWPVMS